ncbi:MAG TPA: ATP-binding protein [Micromonosporaceae bacterium]|nr:ATP-binding protein [Micromonosporaceae bacterium]
MTHWVTWQVDESQPAMRIRLRGTLDATTEDSVRTALNACLATQPDALVVDVRHLAVAEPRALPVFAAAARQAADWPGIPLTVWGLDQPAAPPASPVEAVRRPASRLGLRLEPVAGACRRAREFAAGGCEGWGLTALAGPVSVVVSELVANVVRYAGTPMDVRLTLRPPYLHVTVADGHPGAPRPADPGPAVEGGRGLLLVQSLSQRWGVLPIGQSKVVWATLATT